MKKILFFVALFLLKVHFSYCQKQTVIAGTIKNWQDSVLNIDLLIIDGMSAIRTSKEFSMPTKDGNFKFSFTLNRTSLATIYFNNRIAFSPGTFSIIINPGDSLNFTVPNLKKLGLVNMEVDGVGAERIILFRDIIRKVYANRLFRKTYNKQTVTEKFLEVDRSLDVIDSEFQKIKKPSSRHNQLLHEQLVDQALDMIMIHSLQNKSDSTLILFKKYILNKKRMLPLFNSTTIEYFGGFRLIPNYISLLNRNAGGDNIDRFAEPLQYNRLIVKQFVNKPEIRDYLLSDLAIDIFKEHWDNQISKNMYDFYISHANKKNNFYKRIVQEYKQVEQYLQPGKPFYKFALPDTTGKLHKLEDFNGKIIVLDFWFTGCPGCKLISPVLEKVEEEIKNDGIQFISINVDKAEIWKIGIGEYSSKSSLQLYTQDQRFNHPIIEFAKIPSYPSLIVLDKNGNLVGVPPNPLNHFEEFKSYIKKLL